MNITALFISILIAQAAGGVGSIFTANSVKVWYLTLIKPSFNPPSWVFGPVWTLLFVLMGTAAYLIWQKRGTAGVNLALAVYGTQLVLNALWSYLFFGLHNPVLALVEIVFLWILILACVILFYPISKTASYLMIPYILWVSFAGVLNFFIWRLN